MRGVSKKHQISLLEDLIINSLLAGKFIEKYAITLISANCFTIMSILVPEGAKSRLINLGIGGSPICHSDLGQQPISKALCGNNESIEALPMIAPVIDIVPTKEEKPMKVLN